MKDQLLNLAEKAASYKRGGSHLLKAIGEIQEILANLFDEYSQFRFSHENIAYVANLANSKIGQYGAALCYVRSGDREILKPMPPTWTDAGSGFYLHNDFHVWIDTATRSEIVKVVADLPDFLNSLADFLEAKGAENNISATRIQEIASNLRAAIK